MAELGFGGTDIIAIVIVIIGSGNFGVFERYLFGGATAVKGVELFTDCRFGFFVSDLENFFFVACVRLLLEEQLV